MDISEERAAMQHKLPVIWHQCLLAFAQRYRNDITEDQREALLDLLLTHGHHTIGPEVCALPPSSLSLSLSCVSCYPGFAGGRPLD